MKFLFSHTFCRRLLTIPVVYCVSAMLFTLFPLWASVTLLAGAVNTDWRSSFRCVCFITVYAFCESVGIVVSGLLWLLRPLLGKRRYLNGNHKLQMAWASALKVAAEKLFRLRFIVEGLPALEGPAAIVLPRHTSIGDTILPVVFYALPRDFGVSYVLKRELLLDPCLDIVGNRLPNVFLDRGSPDMPSELSSLEQLAEQSDRSNALVIYLEGTRFSQKKLKRIQQKQGDLQWQTVLPPRLSGTLALMKGAPEKDLLFCAHTGFEASGSFAALFNGGWLDTTVRLHFWRVRAAEIPSGDDERKALLLSQWQTMDRSVAELQSRA